MLSDFSTDWSKIKLFGLKQKLRTKNMQTIELRNL